MQNDIILALPTVGEADRALLRNFLIKRVIHTLTEAEDPTTFEALDADTGAIPQGIGWHETIFWLDPDDTTTAHDGISVLVTDDGYRYKSNELDLRIRAVLDRDITTPPTSGVEIGDAYLVPAGATGDWAGEAESIAVYTARGWQFRAPVIGEWLYIEDEDGYVRYTAAGDWSAGPGARPISANTVPVSAIINAARTSFIVENDTTTAPPASPAVGDAYIIAGSPTGLWAGKATQIAVWETAGAADWTYYIPTNGYQAFNKALNNPYRFNGSAWVSAGGAIVGAATTGLTVSGSTTTGGSANYTYSATVPPTTSLIYLEDSVTLTYQAKKTGARLRFTYTYVAAGSLDCDVALFRDAETNAIGWGDVDHTAGYSVLAIYEITTADASSHVYKFRLIANGGGAVSATTRRTISVEEFA